MWILTIIDYYFEGRWIKYVIPFILGYILRG